MWNSCQNSDIKSDLTSFHVPLESLKENPSVHSFYVWSIHNDSENVYRKLRTYSLLIIIIDWQNFVLKNILSFSSNSIFQCWLFEMTEGVTCGIILPLALYPTCRICFSQWVQENAETICFYLWKENEDLEIIISMQKKRIDKKIRLRKFRICGMGICRNGSLVSTMNKR